MSLSVTCYGASYSIEVDGLNGYVYRPGDIGSPIAMGGWEDPKPICCLLFTFTTKDTYDHAVTHLLDGTTWPDDWPGPNGNWDEFTAFAHRHGGHISE